MKKADRDLATAISPSRLGRVTIRRSAARLGRPPGPGRSSWNDRSVMDRA